MDLNNITAEQQKGLEFLKVRFQVELDDIKSKIVQLNKPFPDDLTTHLQNSFLNKELLFSPSSQIGLKKDQRKEQLERLKGDENERQYLGRIKLSLERFAEAGMRQDLENKLLGIVQNSKLTSNKRMSSFFCLMHSLGFGFKRTSDFVQWAFGQMWVYENRRIAKERKAKMKKNKDISKSEKIEAKDQMGEQNDSYDADEMQEKLQEQQLQQQLQQQQQQQQKLEPTLNQDLSSQQLQGARNSLNNAQSGQDLGKLDGQQDILQKFNLQKDLSNVPGLIDNSADVNNFNKQAGLNLNNNNTDLLNQSPQINGNKAEGNNQIEILQAQLNVQNLIQVKLQAKCKSLEEQNEEKAVQIQQLLNLCENSKNAFQGFLVNLFPLLQQLGVTQEAQQQVQALARQHQYVNASKRTDPSNLDPELQNIIQGKAKQQFGLTDFAGELGNQYGQTGFVPENFMSNKPKIEPKVEHLFNENKTGQDEKLNNSNQQQQSQSQQQLSQFQQQQTTAAAAAAAAAASSASTANATTNQQLQQLGQNSNSILNPQVYNNTFNQSNLNGFSQIQLPNNFMQSNLGGGLSFNNQIQLGQDFSLGNQLNSDLLSQQLAGQEFKQ